MFACLILRGCVAGIGIIGSDIDRLTAFQRVGRIDDDAIVGSDSTDDF